MNRRLTAILTILAVAGGTTGGLIATSTGPARPAPVSPLPPPTTSVVVTSSTTAHASSAAAPTVGETLSTTNGSWTNTPTSYSYQWRQCDAAGATCSSIGGATSTTYAIVTGDIGHTIRVVVTATNSAGSASQTSAQTGVVTGATGTLTFNQGYETGPFTTPGTPGGLFNSIQAGNWSGQSNGALHFFGDAYVDNGTSTSLTTRGTNFNAAGLPNVPAGDGSNSMRLVQLVAPTGQCPGCPAGQNYILEETNQHDLTVPAPGDLGTDKYYGVMFYLPPVDYIPSGYTSGIAMWSMHFNGVWVSPIQWALHTAGPSAVNGTGDSVVIAIESGACNPNVNHQAGVNSGCKYRSDANHPPCGNGTGGFTDPTLGQVTCLPGYFAIPPGGVQYGQWNEVVMHVHWASDTTGQIQAFYKTKSQSSWTAGANVTGIPTVQWNVSQGLTCPSPPTTAQPCGFPVTDEFEAYGGLPTSPWQINYDDQIVGTSLASVENALPTSGTVTPTPPVNTTPASITGSTVQGQVLSAATGTWTGTPAPTFAYQWRSCNSSGASCGDIAAATGSTYTLTSTEVGKTVRVVVTASNTSGTASSTSTQTGVVTGPTGTLGTGVSTASCSGGTCGAVQASADLPVSVSDGAGSTFSRNIKAFYPTGLSGSVPVVIELTDGRTCTSTSNCSDGSEAFFNISAAKKFITIRVACSATDHGVLVAANNCGWMTPDTTPYVLSIFQKCGSSGTALCNDSIYYKYLVETYIPAHISSWCTGGACTLDTSRVFVEGGSKGSAATTQFVCSPLSAPDVAGAFADSTLPSSSTTSSTGPPVLSAAVGCPYHLQNTAPTAWSYTPTGNNSHILMMGYQNSIGDKPQAYTGGVGANGHWGYGEDQAITYITGPDYGCASTFTTSTLTPDPRYTPGNTITAHVHACNGGSAEVGIVENGTANCHAGACDGNQTPSAANAGFQFGPEMWRFWTTGTLF